MAISPKMLAVLQKVDAARKEFIAGLQESARQEAQVRAETLKKKRTSRLEGKRKAAGPASSS